MRLEHTQVNAGEQRAEVMVRVVELLHQLADDHRILFFVLLAKHRERVGIHWRVAFAH